MLKKYFENILYSARYFSRIIPIPERTLTQYNSLESILGAYEKSHKPLHFYGAKPIRLW